MKAPREWLKYVLAAGLLVTALDGLFWSGSQSIATDVLEAKKEWNADGNNERGGER